MKLYKEIEKTFPELEKLFTPEELAKFKNTPAGDIYLYHFGVGLTIRNSDILSQESLLHCLFTNNRITQKDDMSSLMIKLFHYHINR